MTRRFLISSVCRRRIVVAVYSGRFLGNRINEPWLDHLVDCARFACKTSCLITLTKRETFTVRTSYIIACDVHRKSANLPLLALQVLPRNTVRNVRACGYREKRRVRYKQIFRSGTRQGRPLKTFFFLTMLVELCSYVFA